MSHIISICNQKGGVGKTTTAVSLASCLAAAEKKVLLLDIDPQGNATTGFGLDKRSITGSIYDALIGRSTVSELACATEINSLQIVPSNNELAGAEIELVGIVSRETRLKMALKGEREKYDYIVIDCPPSLGLLTLNAMTAADSLIIPVQCEYYAMEGIADLYQTVKLVKAHLNPGLKVRGIVLTMYDGRNNLSRQVVTEVRQYFGEDVFQVVIPRNVKLSEAPSYGKPIILYDVSSRGAQSYFALAAEVIAMEGQNKKLAPEIKKEVSPESSNHSSNQGDVA